MSRSRSPVDRVFDAVVPRAVGAIDPDDLIERIDIDELLERIDMGALIERIDINAIVEKVDIDAIVGKVDIDAIVGRVDIEKIIGRLDMDAIVQRIDINAIVQRVDLDVILDSVDIKAIVHRAGIDAAVAEAATGIAGRTLDVFRRKINRLDTLLLAFVDRVFRRPQSAEMRVDRRASAGPLGRTLGFFLDWVVVSLSFSLLLALGTTLVALFTNSDFDPTKNGDIVWAVLFLGWWFTYLTASIGLGGRTVGKAVLGTKVVAEDLKPAGFRRAAIRTFVFPFSFILGLGFIPAVIKPERRAMHDYAAGTREIVAWTPRGEVPQIIEISPADAA